MRDRSTMVVELSLEKENIAQPSVPRANETIASHRCCRRHGATTHDYRLPSTATSDVHSHADEMSGGRDTKDRTITAPGDALQAVVRATRVELDKLHQRRPEQTRAVDVHREKAIRARKRAEDPGRLRVVVSRLDETGH